MRQEIHSLTLREKLNYTAAVTTAGYLALRGIFPGLPRIAQNGWTPKDQLILEDLRIEWRYLASESADFPSEVRE